MPLTFEEIKSKLVETLDEVSILEILNIEAQELVDRFEDRIEERMNILLSELGEEDDDGEETET
jgi:ribosome assembly protein YihI (activator of Der GTPase)